MNPEIFESIKALIGPGEGRELLDLSCGDGSSSRAYLNMGFKVIATNYDCQGFPHPDIPCYSVDLNQELPFEDGRFDCVILQEVIEHLQNPVLVIKEVHRVLKKRRIFIFSTPNMLNLSSRFHLLLSGFYFGRKKPLKVETRAEVGPNWHVLSFHVYWWLLKGYGFEVEKVKGARLRKRNVVLMSILYPFLLGYSYLCCVWREKGRQRENNAAVIRKINSVDLLCS